MQNIKTPTTSLLLFSILIVSGLFSGSVSADILNATHWIIKPGDSLYKIARNIFPQNTKKQAQLRKELVKQNPDVFRNGTGNISVGDKLKLPEFAIQQQTVTTAPVVVKKTPPQKKSIAKIKPAQSVTTEATQPGIPDPEDIVGSVIINIGSLSAKNRGSIRKLNRRSPIYKGDTISTGSLSLTQIRLKDGALLALRPHTDLKIADYRYNGLEDGSEQSIMELLKGGFRTITGAIGHKNKQNYKIRTSVATIGIRGTHYSLMLCQQASCNNETDGKVDNGLYGGVADGSIIIENETGTHRFNNDQFFKLTSATSMPVVTLGPPPILRHGIAKHIKPPKRQSDQKQTVSKNIKANARRLAVIFEANQPNPVKRRPPVTPDQDIPPLPNTSLFPDTKLTTAPNGSAMLLGFNERDAAGAFTGAAASVIVTANNTNQIILGPNRTPVAARETSIDRITGNLVAHEAIMKSPSGALVTLVPSSVGGNATLGVNWGRWNGDFSITENGKRIDTKKDFHYIYSENITTPTQLANLGGLGANISYNLINGTLPTDELGNVAQSVPSINMSVDFGQQEITNYFISGISHPSGSSFQAEANNIRFQDMSRGFDIVDISVGCRSGPCIGEASVLFVGPQAQGAITSYHIDEPDGSATVTGTGLLTQGGAQF